MVETQHSKEPLHVNDISGKQQLTFAVNRHHPLYKAETTLQNIRIKEGQNFEKTCDA